MFDKRVGETLQNRRSKLPVVLRIADGRNDLFKTEYVEIITFPLISVKIKNSKKLKEM